MVQSRWIPERLGRDEGVRVTGGDAWSDGLREGEADARVDDLGDWRVIIWFSDKGKLYSLYFLYSLIQKKETELSWEDLHRIWCLPYACIAFCFKDSLLLFHLVQFGYFKASAIICTFSLSCIATCFAFTPVRYIAVTAMRLEILGLSGLTQPKFIILQFCGSEVWQEPWLG